MSRVLSLNLCWLRSANHVKFTEEYLMCTDKYVLIKTIKKGFATRNLSQKVSPWRRKTHWLSAKEIIQAQLSVKKVVLTVFWDNETTHQYWFLWKKRSSCKQGFLLLTLLAKFSWFVEWSARARAHTHTHTYTHIYIYIYIYIFKSVNNPNRVLNASMHS